MSVSGWMFLLVPVHPGCPGQNPQSRKMVVCVCHSINQLFGPVVLHFWPTFLNRWENIKHWLQAGNITHWLYHFFTITGSGEKWRHSLFMPAVQTVCFCLTMLISMKKKYCCSSWYQWQINEWHYCELLFVEVIWIWHYESDVCMGYSLYQVWLCWVMMHVMCDRKPQFANLVTHPGFSDQLCYGDVTLRFMYIWSEMSKHDRERILRENRGLESPGVSLEQKPLHDASKMAAQCV